MMTLRTIYRAKKLIRITLEYDEVRGVIGSIIINGDFFVYPEEALHELEMDLVGIKADHENIKHLVDKFLTRAEAYGFDSESLTVAIMSCLRSST